MKIFFPVLIICFFCFCCSNKQEKNGPVLSEKEMTEIMWDLMRADQFVQDFVLKDSTKNKKAESIKLYEEIFLLHHTTHGQFEKSKNYYQSNPLLFRPIMDSLVKKQNSIKPVIPTIRPDTVFQHLPGKHPPKE